MKSLACALICASIAFTAFPETRSAALPRVAIAGFANRTGDASFDTPSATATESLALTIRLLGSYELVAPATTAPGLTDKHLLPWCEGESVDYVLYGSIGALKGGAQEYALALFDRAKGKTTIRKTARGASVFDVFSCADTLTFAVIDAIAGRHVGFGSVSFEVANPGAEGTATVTLDGAKIAEGFSPIERVIEGRHLVSVSWRAPGAKPKEIALVEVEVAEGERAFVPVTLPAKAAARAATKAPQSASEIEGMVFVEGGSFTMGSDSGPANERPAHEVTVGSFWMGKTEVTQGEFSDLMKYLPTAAGNGFSQKKHGAPYPVLLYRWIFAIEYCNARSIREGLTPAYSIRSRTISWNRLADGYRLPTEAEWEYAAKGGPNHDAFLYPGSDDARDVAVTATNANGNGFAVVASKRPNTLGIYDLGGNVGEWCWDSYGPYGTNDAKGLLEETTDKARVLRGGDSMHKDPDARCTARYYAAPELKDNLNNGYIDLSRNIGFRVVRSAIADSAP